MSLSDLEPVIDIAQDKFNFPSYSVVLADGSRKFEENEVVTLDYSGRRIFVKNDPNLKPAFVLDGVLWCFVIADYSRGRENDLPYVWSLQTSQSIYGVELGVQQWLRKRYDDEFEKIGPLYDKKLKAFLSEEKNADVKFGLKGIERKFDEAKHSSAYIAIRIRSTANHPASIDDTLRSTLGLEYPKILEFLASRGYPVTRRVIPSLEKSKPYAEVALTNVREDLQVRFFFKEAGFVFNKLIGEESPADKDLKDLFLRALQIVDSADVDDTFKDKPDKKKILVNALERSKGIIWAFEQESELVTVSDKI